MNSEASLFFDKSNLTPDFITEGFSFKAFYHLIDRHAKKYPDHTAIKFNNISWTYREVSELSSRLSRLLVNIGVKKGDIVGLALDRSPEMIISLLGILKAGAAYVPLDPGYPKDRIEFMLSDSSARMLLTSKKYQDHFNSGATELLIEDAWAQLDNYNAEDLDVAITGVDIAYVLYTSGSTGKPKGVIVTHQNLGNFLASMQKMPGMSADDRLLAISTMSFDIAALELYLPLISGAGIVLASAETAKDGWLLLELIRQEQITIMQATPYTWRMLIAAGWEEQLPIRIITGGEQLPKDLAEKLLKLTAQLWNQYGPTETTVYSTQKLINSADDITIGKPIDRTQVYILDESLNELPVGASGEIFIAGDGVAKGYLKRPELTAERFIDDPFSPEKSAKMYRTGDLGVLTQNGEIQCLGRIDQQVKIRGFRIELEEIEYELLKAEGVKETVVAVWADASRDPQLIAYIVAGATNAALPEKSGLKQLLSETLPAYMVPDDFVFLSSLPVTPNGKVDRKALPKPEISVEAKKGNYVAPKTESEKQLVQIWQDVMGIKDIGTEDNFFELGGHSLVAVKIMTRIKKITGRRLPIAKLLKYPTIAELAAHLNTDDSANGFDSLVAIRPKGSRPPIYIIHGDGLNVLYFTDLAKKLDNQQPVYGLQARGLKGNEPLEVMEEIASNYVTEIIVQNPAGPYVLAGYSIGGYIAVEMRKQMIAAGKEVKLIIFDTDAEKSDYKSWLYLVPRKIKRRFDKAISQVKSLTTNPAGILFSQTKKVPVKLSAKEDSKDFYREIKRVQEKLHYAVRNYSIEPFDDKVYLYKAKICTHYVDDTEFLGWKKYAKKGVEICEVAGDHLSMLLHPNVDDFAVKLQNGINNLQVL